MKVKVGIGPRFFSLNKFVPTNIIEVPQLKRVYDTYQNKRYPRILTSELIFC